VAEPGNKIITADYSQIELRILAEFSQDPVFLDAFRSGQDLHKRTASQIFNIPFDAVSKDQRNIAKTINFGLAYGMSASSLSESVRIPKTEAEKFIVSYFRAYSTIKKCLDRLGMAAVRNGYSQTPLGRKRYYKPAHSFGERESRERQGRNTPIQATCADILKTAILLLCPLLSEYEGKMINLVHDEIVFEVKAENAEALKAVIEAKMVERPEHGILILFQFICWLLDPFYIIT
jgi:DNA polymerase-1